MADWMSRSCAAHQRRGMVVTDLVALFKRDRGEELSDDALLLT